MILRYIWPALAGALITALLVPAAVALAKRLGAVDKPGGRRVNGHPVPRLGGLAIYIGFISALLFLPGERNARSGLLVAGTLAFAVGLLDDLFSLKPAVKLAGQIAAAAALPVFGIAIRYVTNPWGGMLALGWLAAPATVLWVVAMMNMINLIDGLDGLAAGVSAIAAFNLLLLPQCVERPFVASLCLITIGCVLGFLPFNFHPARTFMGDGGAHFLGFVLGFITVTGALKGRAALTLSVPVLVLAVPFADTILAIIRRWRRRQPLFAADGGHLHHRLILLGLNQRQAVLLLYLFSAFFGASSVFLVKLAARFGALLLAGLLACGVFGLSRLTAARISNT